MTIPSPKKNYIIRTLASDIKLFKETGGDLETIKMQEFKSNFEIPAEQKEEQKTPELKIAGYVGPEKGIFEKGKTETKETTIVKTFIIILIILIAVIGLAFLAYYITLKLIS